MSGRLGPGGAFHPPVAAERAARIDGLRPATQPRTWLDVMEVMANNWQCDSCDHAFQYDGDPAAARCPACSNEWLTRFIDVHDELRLKVSGHVVMKGKGPALPSKRKLLQEVRSGIRPEGNGSGRLVEERRIADADSDEYEEHIVYIDSGVVVRDLSEPLSEHRGGSEKWLKK